MVNNTRIREVIRNIFLEYGPMTNRELAELVIDNGTSDLKSPHQLPHIMRTDGRFKTFGKTKVGNGYRYVWGLS